MDRRGFLFGLGAVAAPAIVSFPSLMKLPRVPFMEQTPSGLWVKVKNQFTGRTEFFPATANMARNVNDGVCIDFKPPVDVAQFDHVTVGAGELELLYYDLRSDPYRSSIAMHAGDSLRLKVSLD